MDELTASSQLSPSHSQSTDDAATQALEQFLASDEYPLSHYLSQHGVALSTFFSLTSDAPKFEKAKQVFCVDSVMLSKLKKLVVQVFADSIAESVTSKTWLAFITAKATAFPVSAASEILLSYQLLLCSMYFILSQTATEHVVGSFQQFALGGALGAEVLAKHRQAFAALLESDYDELESVYAQFWAPFQARMGANATSDALLGWLAGEYEGSFPQHAGFDERLLDADLSTKLRQPQPSTPPRNELARSLLHVDSFSTPVM